MNQRITKNILINPGFQLRLIGFFLGLTLILFLLQMATLFIFFDRFNSLLSRIGLPDHHMLFTFLHKQKIFLYTVYGTLGLVVGILMLIGGFIVSHRVAGPIKKIENEINAMDPHRPETLKLISLRAKDFFPELKDAVNSLVAKMRKS